jgi:hypothetical protein
MTGVVSKACDWSRRIEYVIDPAFATMRPVRRWTTMDFKIGREFGETSDRYSARLSKPVARAKSAPARGALLMELPWSTAGPSH